LGIFLDEFIDEQNRTIDETSKAIEDLSKEECAGRWYARKNWLAGSAARGSNAMGERVS
jgi:hypothetical protein